MFPLVTELPDIQSGETSDCCGGDHRCSLEDRSLWSKLRFKPEPHVLHTSCPEGKDGRSDLRHVFDVSSGIEEVTGFLRVTKTLMEEAVRTMSGRRGVFVDNLAQQGVRFPVAWITRLQDETAEEYFSRVMCQAGQKGLAYGRGGSSHLGVRGGD